MDCKIQVFNFDLVSSDYDFKGIVQSDFTDSLSVGITEIKQDLNIIFVSPKKIKELNLEFRNKDEVTDVLSFETDTSSEIAEIYICPDYILRRIKDSTECSVELVNSRLFLVDIVRMIIHGYLHVAGYDHKGYFEGSYALNDFDNLESKDKIEDMFVEQERILTIIINNLKS